jgi:hypothetical protein
VLSCAFWPWPFLEGFPQQRQAVNYQEYETNAESFIHGEITTAAPQPVWAELMALQDDVGM